MSQFIPTCYKKININEIETNKLCRDSLVMTDITISTSCTTHSSYMDICDSLYNNVKYDDQTWNLIVDLLLEFK